MSVSGNSTPPADAPDPGTPKTPAGPGGQVAVQSERRQAVMRVANTSPVYMLGVLVGIFIVFSVINESAFLSGGNLQNIALNAATFLVMAVGTTYLFVAAGFDLSLGSVLVFANVIAAKVMGWVGGNGFEPVIIGLIAGIGAGGAWGLFNGFCVTKLRVPALITTLGTLGAALGVAYVITSGNDIRSVPSSLVSFGTATFLGLSWIVWVAVVLTLIAGLFLHLTRFGRHTYVIGSNIEAARRAGINVDRHLLKLYTFSGMTAGLAGFLALAQFASTTISAHSNDVLSVITGVVLGGASLYGGYGWMIGTVIGILIPTALNDGLVIANVQSFWQQVATGFILIAAVYIDQLKRRSRERS